jgi:proline racemase
VSPGAHAGVLFFHQGGYSAMCGHGLVAVTTIALERGLLMPGPDVTTIVYDTPAGTVRARARLAAGSSAGETPQQVRVESVSFVNVPSFVLHAGLPLRIGTRQFRADVAYGGVFVAIVDSEAVGVPIDAAHVPELRRAGMAIKDAVEAAQSIVHPTDQRQAGIHGVVFTAPARDAGADLRSVAVFGDASVGRSPSATGACAVMAVIDAMGLFDDEKPFVIESIIGTRFEGRIAARGSVGDLQAVIPEIRGAAWITGEHTFLVLDGDPLRDGFRL